jgi:uncharacterized protein (DUF2336 family)
MAKNVLSHSDVMGLLKDPSGQKRAETAEKIATEFDRGSLSDGEKQLATQIFRLMVRDAEVRVREALANNLKSNPLVPHDVAVSLAQDVHSVALPIIESSDVLTDEDLIDIINLNDPTKQVAIASRPAVSETVSDAIVETKNEQVVSRLVSNPGAEISEGSLGKVVESLGDSESVQDAMSGRARLPVTIAERLVTMVSERLHAKMAERIELPADALTDLVMQIRERAVLSISVESEASDLQRLVRQLKTKGRLTPSILLRALCMGDTNFFQAGMAELAQVAIDNARDLIDDSGDLGLRGIFDKAGLPSSFFPAVRAAIDVAKETEYDGGEHDLERYSRRMIERILTQYGDLGVEFEADDLEYLLTKMNSLPIETSAQA